MPDIIPTGTGRAIPVPCLPTTARRLSTRWRVYRARGPRPWRVSRPERPQRSEDTRRSRAKPGSSPEPNRQLGDGARGDRFKLSGRPVVRA